MNNIPDEVIQRFAYKKNLPLTDARAIFDELTTFLDSASHRILSPSLSVDEAWHEFIIHTKYYFDYCTSRFGKVIHHVPTSPTKCDSTDCETAVFQDEHPVTYKLQLELNDCSSDCDSGD